MWAYAIFPGWYANTCIIADIDYDIVSSHSFWVSTLFQGLKGTNPMSKYKIDTIHYRDKFGKLLYEEPMIFSSLHGVDETMVFNRTDYKVVRVAVVDNIQHVNMVEITKEEF